MAKVRMIEVGGTTCGVCKMMKPMVEKVVSLFTADELDFTYVYGDTPDGQRFMDEESIGEVSKVPTFIIKVDGVEKERFDGGMTLPALRDKIKTYL